MQKSQIGFVASNCLCDWSDSEISDLESMLMFSPSDLSPVKKCDSGCILWVMTKYLRIISILISVGTIRGFLTTCTSDQLPTSRWTDLVGPRRAEVQSYIDPAHA